MFHEGFPNQNRTGAALLQTIHIGACVDAAFGDEQ